MNMNQIISAAVIALAFGTTACAKSEPEQKPAAVGQEQANPQGMDHGAMPMEHGQMQDDCDMQSMDMSTMSAEEHQAMMDKCQQTSPASDGHGDHEGGAH